MPDNAIGHLYAPIGATKPADVVMSPDDTKLYVSGTDGKVLVYDLATHALLTSWDVGISLGGMDVSPDGHYLVVAEKSVVGFRSEGQYGPYYSTQIAYRVDTSTGQVTSYSMETAGGDHTFHDAAILNNGTVLLSQSAYSAFLPYYRLDLATGHFDYQSADYSIRGSLSTTHDHGLAIFTPGNISTGQIYTVSTGGQVINEGGNSGYNTGILAVNNSANLVAQYRHGGGLTIYDINLNFVVNLGALYSQDYLGTNLAGLAFSVSGDQLFVLHAQSNKIFDISTTDWHLIRTFDVGASVGDDGIGGYGNRLLVSDDQREFTVVTSTGLRVVENDAVANDFVGSAGNDDFSAGLGDDRIFGGDGNDHITGDQGNDELHGGNGADSLIGGTGADTLFGDGDDDSLTGGSGDDILSGGAGNDVLVADSEGADPFGNDMLNGGAGNDTLSTSGGTVLADGGSDTDTLVINWAGSANNVHGSAPFAPNGGGGFDGAFGDDAGRAVQFTGIEALQITTGSGADTIITGGTRDTVTLGSGDDTASTGAGDDFIDGGVGADTMTGGDGNDIYVVDDAGDSVTELAGEGIDEVRTSLGSYVLGTNFERLTGNSALGQSLTGNAANNVILAAGGNDRLDGGLGADSMTGGRGNDVYYVDNSGDQVFEIPNQGSDAVYASLSYALAAGQSIETLAAADPTANSSLDLTGNASAQTIIGNAGVNLLTSGGGTDYLVGLAGDDILIGNASAASTLEGGTGNDWYYVSRTGDSVVEAAGQGNDRIFASASFTLSAGQEIENIGATDPAGTSAINLTGNEAAQVIGGNAGANILTSGGGADYLVGFGGDDILVGNATTASTLQGGTGNDWYYITRTGDSLVEFAGEGNDRILTSVSYTLSTGQEIETLSALDPAATTGLGLTGNALSQAINGNAGANVLTGGGGSDSLVGLGGDDILIGNADAASTLQGGTGNDWYYVSRTGDSIVELGGEGNDRIITSVNYTVSAGVEIETLLAANQSGTVPIDLVGNDFAQAIYGTNGANGMSGNGGADQLAGFGGDDILLGGEGDDQLNGGLGHDVLNGGNGADLFVFADAFGSGNVDTVQDLTSGSDRLALDHNIFTGLSTGLLSSSALVIGTAAQDSDDRIIYNQATGELWFDADGNGAGAAMLFATLAPATVLAAADIVVI